MKIEDILMMRRNTCYFMLDKGRKARIVSLFGQVQGAAVQPDKESLSIR